MSTMTVYQSKMNEQMEQFDALMRAQILKSDQRTQQLAMLANNTLGGNIGSSPIGQMIIGNLINSPALSPFMGGNILNTYGALSNAYGQTIMDVGLHFGGGRNFNEGFMGRGINTAAVAAEMTRQINNEFFSPSGIARNGGNYNHNDIGAAIALLGTNGYFHGRNGQQWGQVYQFAGDESLQGPMRGGSVFLEAQQEIRRLRSGGQNDEADKIQQMLNRYKVRGGAEDDITAYDTMEMSEGLTLTNISKDKREELTRMLRGMTTMLTSAKDVFKTLKEDSPALFQAVEALTGESVTTLNGASLAQQKLERFQRFARTTGRDSEQLASQAIQSSVALSNATGMPLVLSSRITENSIFDSIIATRNAQETFKAMTDAGYDMKAPNEAKIASYSREAQMAVLGENPGLMGIQWAMRHGHIDPNNKEALGYIRTITGDRTAPGSMERIRSADDNLMRMAMNATGRGYEELLQTASETMTATDADRLSRYAREGASQKAWTYIDSELERSANGVSGNDSEQLKKLISTVGMSGVAYIQSAGADVDLMNDRRFRSLSEAERRAVLTPDVRDLVNRNRRAIGVIAENDQSQAFLSTLSRRQQDVAEYSDYVGRSVSSADLTQTGLQGLISNIMNGMLSGKEELKRLTEDGFVKTSVVAGWSDEMKNSREIMRRDKNGNFSVSDGIGEDILNMIISSLNGTDVSKFGLKDSDLTNTEALKNRMQTLNDSQLHQVLYAGTAGKYQTLSETTKEGDSIFRVVKQSEIDDQRKKNAQLYAEKTLENIRKSVNPEAYFDKDIDEEIIGYTNNAGESIALKATKGYMLYAQGSGKHGTYGKHGVSDTERTTMLAISEKYRNAQAVLNDPNASEEAKAKARSELQAAMNEWNASGFDKLDEISHVTEDVFKEGGDVRADANGRSASWLSNNGYVRNFERGNVATENIDAYIAAKNFQAIEANISVVDGKYQIMDKNGKLRDLSDMEARSMKGAADSGLYRFLKGDHDTIKANRDYLEKLKDDFKIGDSEDDVSAAIANNQIGKLDEERIAAFRAWSKANHGGDDQAAWNALGARKNLLNRTQGTGLSAEQMEMANEVTARQLGVSNTKNQYETEVLAVLKEIAGNTKNGTPPN